MLLDKCLLENNCLYLLYPSKNVSFNKKATLFPLLILSKAFNTNSVAYLYGGFVIISPLNFMLLCKK